MSGVREYSVGGVEIKFVEKIIITKHCKGVIVNFFGCHENGNFFSNPVFQRVMRFRIFQGIYILQFASSIIKYIYLVTDCQQKLN
jgi:hypothetical protein